GLDRGVKGRVRGRGVQLLFGAAAEVELDSVEPPRRERVHVPLVVAAAALSRAAAAVAPGVGVDARQQPGGVQRAGQPGETLRPLAMADADLAACAARALPPADIEPHVAIP